MLDDILLPWAGSINRGRHVSSKLLKVPGER
jgi:hypothetical protein